METMARELELSPQALQQRLGPEAQAFLRALLSAALRQALNAPRQRLGLLDGFTAVVVEDTTTIALPTTLGGRVPRLRRRRRGGRRRRRPQGAGALGPVQRRAVGPDGPRRTGVGSNPGGPSRRLAPGSLHVADQGFFNSERWRAFAPQHSGSAACRHARRSGWQQGWQTLGALLGGVTRTPFDEAVLLVQTAGLPCRLVARRCPPEVAGRRRQKLRDYTRDKKGREPSAAQLLLCDWLVFATNVPARAAVGQGAVGGLPLPLADRVACSSGPSNWPAGASVGAAAAAASWWNCTPSCWGWSCCIGAPC